MFLVRPETTADHSAVYKVVSTAFKTADEAELVNRLRPILNVISLVALHNEKIVGHIMFSPVALIDENDQPITIKIIGLAPVAVSPEHQHVGVGKALINAGLEVCQKSGYQACVLLGHPDYYPKFGFKPALSVFGIRSTYEVPDPVFMALELESGALNEKSGTIHYHPTFNGV
ncbi:MAG: putative acetyltransferase [Cellvibrionaceae bacterium]|jgi:putative acetyltransferase